MSVQLSYFYQFVKASGLVKSEVLDAILDDFDQNRASSQPSAELTDLRHLRKPARLRFAPWNSLDEAKSLGSGHSGSSTPHLDRLSLEEDAKENPSPNTNLPPQTQINAFDLRLAEELIRQGHLNAWQTAQLYERRTKFTLGNYWVLDAIGQGGYGHVFLGLEKMTPDRRNVKNYVALKVLPLARSTPELKKRFAHEIDVQNNLQHPNLVRFLDSGEDGNVQFMVHEFIDGDDLRTFISRSGKLSIEVAAPIIAQMARALQYLHEKGIVHRDVKPANILLSSQGQAKLTDMGLAIHSQPAEKNRQGQNTAELMTRQESDLPPKKTGKIAGTVDYMAPDQIRDPSRPSSAWDIYSLGCVFFYMLTGTVPFPNGETREKLLVRLAQDPPDVRLLATNVPFDIADLLKNMLHHDPAKRIANGEEIAKRLDAWTPPLGILDQVTFDALQVPEPEPPLTPFFKNRA